MTDNEFIGKYQNALSNLCGVEYPYMQGDPDVDAIAELISLYIQQMHIINRQKAEIEAWKDQEQRAHNYCKSVCEPNYKAEIQRLESEIDKQYEIAEGNIRAEIASGGTSCHWCEAKAKAEARKEFADRLTERCSPFQMHGCYPDTVLTRIAEIYELVDEMDGDV